LYTNQQGNLTPSRPSIKTGMVQGAADLHVLHGVQSVGLNTTFNLEQVFELGQIHIYENIEGVPDVEVTLEKVLDGHALMYHVASAGIEKEEGIGTSSKASLVARSKQRTNVYLGIFPETVENVGDTTAGAIEVQMSGMYISSIGYTLPTDGNCTESLTLVGNHKSWSKTNSKFSNAVAKQLDSARKNGDTRTNLYDVPANMQPGSYYGGVQRRENVDIKHSILPASLYGVTKTAVNSAPQVGNGWRGGANATGGEPLVHIQNCSISCDLNRESVQELGRKAPYYRFANFPVEVTCEFEVISTSGDGINAYEEGFTNGSEGGFPVNSEFYGNNTAEETIMIKLHDGTVFDLGPKNRLSSVNYTGGDAGGGSATMTYSYSTFNALTVTHPKDPAGIANSNAAYGPVYNGGKQR
jgi:hypothetical protein